MPASAMLLHQYTSPIAAIVRYCAVHTAVSLIRSAGRHHRIAVCATCTAPYPHTHPVDRGCHIAAFYAVVAVITPRRLVLPIRRRGRYDDDLPERKLCHTAPSRYVSPLHFSTTACRLRRRCVAPSDALPTYRDAHASHRCRSPFI